GPEEDAGSNAAATLGALDAPGHDHPRTAGRDAQGLVLPLYGVPGCPGWRLRVRSLWRDQAAARRAPLGPDSSLAIAESAARQFRRRAPPRLRRLGWARCLRRRPYSQRRLRLQRTRVDGRADRPRRLGVRGNAADAARPRPARGDVRLVR